MNTDSALEWEGEAEFLLRKAGVELDDPRGAPYVAKQLLGVGCIERVPREALAGKSALFDRTRSLIQVATDLGPKGQNFSVGHELGEWRTGELDYRATDRESVCNRIGIGIIAPRAAMKRAISVTGFNLRRLSDIFVVGMPAIALRYGEVTGYPIGVASERAFMSRGGPYEWGDLAVLRQLARNPPRTHPIFKFIRAGSGRVIVAPVNEIP